MSSNIKVVLGVLLGSALALGLGILIWSARPSYVVARVAWATYTKDYETFREWVDIEKVADGLSDDVIALALKQYGADPLDNASQLQTVVAQAMVQGLKPQLKGYVFKTVESYFNGDPAVNSSGQSLNSLVLMLLASNSSLNFSWSLRTSPGQGFSHVSADFVDAKTSKRVPIIFRIEPSESHGRIVKITNLVEALGQR